MPKNFGKGGNKRKKGKKPLQDTREFRFKEECEEYARIIKLLGDGRFQCTCSDGVDRIAHLRHKMWKKVWLKCGDVVLISLRDYEPEKCDIIDKYTEKEIAKLLKNGEIKENLLGEEEAKKIREDDVLFEDSKPEKMAKKKENSNGFEIESEDDEEEEEEEYKEEEKEIEKDEDGNSEIEKDWKNKNVKKEKDRKRKNNRDKKQDDDDFNGDFIIKYI